MSEIKDIGWEFPPRFDKISNAPSMLNGEHDIINSIYVILHTKLGERILRNEFGSNIHDLLFEPLNANVKTYMGSTLKQALDRNEPRIEVKSVVLEQPIESLGRIEINIEFTFLDTGNTNTVVVPFNKSYDLA